MSPRAYLATDVFSEAVDRMVKVYERGDRVVVSISGGKDSTCCLEICAIAAEVTGRLPVEAVIQDEEVSYPGTYEYLERVCDRSDVSVFWAVARQPMVNLFNRRDPYFWIFDPLIPESDWVRPFPKHGREIGDLDIENLTVPRRFPPPEGKELMNVLGLRVQESRRRAMGLHSSGGYVTGLDPRGFRKVRPIYDWTDGDVWRAIQLNGWDYNRAYDTFNKMGISRKALRIGPPTMTMAGVQQLQVGARAWPGWFERVCARLPGVRQVALFGVRAVQPERRAGENWQQTFERECLAGPTELIRERSRFVMEKVKRLHAHHSTDPVPEVNGCRHCTNGQAIASWRAMTMVMWNGDPYSLKTYQLGLPYVEPEYFRKGAGTWQGKPTW